MPGWTPVHCTREGCTNYARINSKYCSNRCKNIAWELRKKNAPPPRPTKVVEIYYPGCSTPDHLSKAKVTEMLFDNKFMFGTQITFGEVRILVQ